MANKRLQLKGRLKKMDEIKSNPSSGEQVVVKSADEQRKTEKQQPTNDNKFEPAIKILRQRKKGAQTEYQVLFADNSRHWCDRVSEALLAYFRLQQAKRRTNRRRNER